MSFYSPDNKGIQGHDEAIDHALHHVPDGDPLGYGYEHCAWCGNEWPCVTAALWHHLEFAHY